MTRLAPLLALLLSGCILGPEGANCDFSEDCASCLERAGCGWCPDRGCVDGNSLGPDLGACTDYRWDDCTARVDPCARHRDCGTCLMASSCAWCPAVGGGSCSLNGQACPGSATNVCTPPPRCADFFSCGSCTSDPACEWEDGFGSSVCDAESCRLAGSGGDCRDRTFCF